ncbi:MAG: hypothetical protein WC876_08590, partial [Candidatus Thermoplasmatota archaeon]
MADSTAKALPKQPALLVADEAWLATCMLIQERHAEGVPVHDIVRRAQGEFYGGQPARPGVYAHANGHIVANKPPSTATGYRMLVAFQDPQTGEELRRPFVEGDPCHAKRSGKMVPESADIPRKYHPHLEWYRTEYAPSIRRRKRRSGEVAENQTALQPSIRIVRRAS